jgi:hypothetical protein
MFLLNESIWKRLKNVRIKIPTWESSSVYVWKFCCHVHKFSYMNSLIVYDGQRTIVNSALHNEILKNFNDSIPKFYLSNMSQQWKHNHHQARTSTTQIIREDLVLSNSTFLWSFQGELLKKCVITINSRNLKRIWINQWILPKYLFAKNTLSKIFLVSMVAIKIIS